MIRVYGSSDDLVEVEGSVTEEINVIDRPAIITITEGDAIGVRVVAEYSDEGVWRVGAEQCDEGQPAPWPIRIENQHAYSLAVIVDCPDTVKVTFQPLPG